jgi:sulfur-oxidizing protein SoxY
MRKVPTNLKAFAASRLAFGRGGATRMPMGEIAMFASSRIMSRREFAAGALAIAAAAVAPPLIAADETAPSELTKLLGQRPLLSEGRIKLELPESADNGYVVPVSVMVQSPMMPDDYVKALHLFAELNPAPHVASYLFTPANGKAAIATRIRLTQSQHVIAIAEMIDGSLHIAQQMVRITRGGTG